MAHDCRVHPHTHTQAHTFGHHVNVSWSRVSPGNKFGFSFPELNGDAMVMMRVSANNPSPISSYLWLVFPLGCYLYLYSRNFFPMMSLDGFRQKIAKRIAFLVRFSILFYFFPSYFWQQQRVDDVKLRLACVRVVVGGRG